MKPPEHAPSKPYPNLPTNQDLMEDLQATFQAASEDKASLPYQHASSPWEAVALRVRHLMQDAFSPTWQAHENLTRTLEEQRSLAERLASQLRSAEATVIELQRLVGERTAQWKASALDAKALLDALRVNRQLSEITARVEADVKRIP